MLNDVIEIHSAGDRASGVWRNIQPVTIKDDAGNPEAMWMLAKYDEEYIKINGQWFFLTLTADIQFSASYDKGWAEAWPSGL